LHFLILEINEKNYIRNMKQYHYLYFHQLSFCIDKLYNF